MDDLRVVEWENATCPTGDRGVGCFAGVPERLREATVRLIQDIVGDDEGDDARRHLQRAGRAHRSVQPILYWLLAASPDETVGLGAAEKLVELCGQESRRLGIDRFVDASPTLVRERIAAASEERQ